uniref:Enoyl-[acyl-carrier-protein] reductase, mitochondrial n=1 Tax=Acrobeloides nanus TaxID=290746 RepID=A0A914BYU8_9BILA
MFLYGKFLENVKIGIRMTHIWSRCIQYEKHGPPNEVLSLHKSEISSEVSSNKVLVKWLASPINPLDINKIEGTYPWKKEFPIVGGSEGTGVIEKVGNNVHDLKPGDSVVSMGIGVPLWNEYCVVDNSQLMKIDSRLDLISAATLIINPPTAYAMLKDYVDLDAGDIVIQNAANSGVGRSVIQLAKIFGLKSINLIRDRPNVQELKNELRQLGADFVFTEEEFRNDATLIINPPTAYAMLKDYVDLDAGDIVIQNAANSGVGRSVIQLAKIFGLKSINLIRDRPNVQELKNELRQLGADFVFTEEEFRNDGKKFLTSLSKPIRLAINGVGDRSCLAISSALSAGGTLITYGGMSKKSHLISTSSFVFKNIKAVGIAAGWLLPQKPGKVQAMFDHIQKLCINGQLKPPPVETYEMEQFSKAINRALEGKHGKQVLLLHPDSKLKNKL